MPNVDLKEGIWAACGVNEKNVGMSATETITTNPRVLGVDPYVTYRDKNHVGGIGEEDLVVLILPYIKSAKEGVIRLGELLEKYGTYESNGIVFSDKNEIWYVETIGGHHFIAKRVKDDECVILPNQFNIDNFDFIDAYSSKKENMCSSDMKEFLEKNNLNLNNDGKFNPRLAFGSHSDSDHIYNNPRAYFMLFYLNRNLFEEGNYTPESDNIPFSFKPDRLLTIEDVKYVLSSHYQGFNYDPYLKDNENKKVKYRPIGISRTSFLGIVQIRNNVDENISAIEWIGFASNVFNTLLPFYTNTEYVPSYLGNTTLKVSTSNFYYASRLIAALADAHYNTCMIHVERYQDKTMAYNHELINKFDNAYKKDISVIEFTKKANIEITSMIQKQTDDVLSKVLYDASCHMKNSFSKSDN